MRTAEPVDDLAPPPEDAAGLGPDADPEAVGRAVLLDQLTGRARSRSELAEKLARKHVPADVADRLLDRFEEVGLVDDAAFAREWVQTRHAGRGLARRALTVELQRKGVDAEVVSDAVSAIEPDDEEEAARELVRRKLRSVARFDRPVQERRLQGMLARKGYPAGVVFRVVREELRDVDVDADGDAGGWTGDEVAQDA